MFKHLRVKLTVLYAALFCATLLLIGATAYVVIEGNTQRIARAQLASIGAVFDRTWGLRFRHLQDSAFQTAGSPTFQAAATARDDRQIEARLRAVREAAGADIAFLVTREGLIVGEHGGPNASVTPGLQVALAREQTPQGVFLSGDDLYQTTTAPLPMAQGWIVLGARLDRAELTGLERLSSMPVRVTALFKTVAGWTDGEDPASAETAAFIDQATASTSITADELETSNGAALALVRPLPSLDGTRGVLLLRYPLSRALSPYNTLFNTLLAIGFTALALLIAGSWFLARSITQPLSTLETAAKKMQQGVYESIVVRTKDELSRVAASFNAMTEAIRERERKITQLAYHDGETRLPNRLALERKLAAAQPDRLYLAAIGVDRFAHVRGAIGYSLTGVLLRTLGSRLARLVPNAPLGRLSSDMLGVAFLANDDADARKRADALVANLEESLSLDGQVVDINVTVGVAQPRVKGESPASMIERASIALDQARASLQKVGVFDPAAYGDPARNLSLMGEMRRALEDGDIHLVHQPKYNYRTGRIDSAESLVRWRHPSRGMIPPDLFVPMAEETGHVRALTDWVLQRAVEDQQRLSAAGFKLTLAINISARLLSDTEFAQSAIQLVRQAPHTICFEITETAVIDNPKVALENIELFAANGIRVAIDDYGSGLSSLAYLKQLPAHELKIDKMFVQNITTNQRDALLVRSTIDLAHGLGMDVTAEGVETPAAFALLATMRCNLAQGYLVSRPASLDELVALLADEKRLKFYQQTAASSAHVAPVPSTDTSRSA